MSNQIDDSISTLKNDVHTVFFGVEQQNLIETIQSQALNFMHSILNSKNKGDQKYIPILNIEQTSWSSCLIT